MAQAERAQSLIRPRASSSAPPQWGVADCAKSRGTKKRQAGGTDFLIAGFTIVNCQRRPDHVGGADRKTRGHDAGALVRRASMSGEAREIKVGRELPEVGWNNPLLGPRFLMTTGATKPGGLERLATEWFLAPSRPLKYGAGYELQYRYKRLRKYKI
jgi:hypothetical protein